MRLELKQNQMETAQLVMGGDGRKKTIETTIGDLVAALSHKAFELCGDSRQAYLLAGLTLEAILGMDLKWRNRQLEAAPIRIPIHVRKTHGAKRKVIKVKFV